MLKDEEVKQMGENKPNKPVNSEIDLTELVRLEEDASPATGAGCGGIC